ncbi:MAG TPA: glycosyltransferase family 39 protein [Actinophytocola sp.]|jgi:4-amino-4-deoxy-L-arabinose transferase-like glycosyltransferase|uniref:ArnT family glycosyltransferase n=1 Tax=Actinophytocola sp. TaxID=1872138 RepID=UPI002E04F0C9|nr:glycosyltransferase family 39 protein [Actinophytocola sp.]
METGLAQATADVDDLPGPAGTRARWAPWRSPEEQPRWARPALLIIAAAAGTLYAWGIAAMQLHLYYGPAVRSMSGSWSAFFFATYDPQVTVTLDKLPGAFWVQALSARIFGFHPWSVLLPQVLACVATILVLYKMIHRWMGPAAGLLAAAGYATMPIVAALARTQISDVVLVLLLVLAADAWQRAILTGRLAPLLWSGVWVGLAFQTKLAQAWAVLPAFALVYLFTAPAPLRRRAGQLTLAGAVSLAVSFLWIVPMLLIPATARPYIDGSVDNSPLSMVFGYNGFNRYGIANEGAEVLGTGGPVRAGPGSPWSYLLSDGVAPQVGWLYPLAIAGLVAGLIWAARWRPERETRFVRAVFAMWGLWLLIHAIAFGISRNPHTFYVIAIAPPVVALAGAGTVLLWSAYRRGTWWPLPTVLAVTTVWAVTLSARFPTFAGWLPPTLAITGATATLTLIAAKLTKTPTATRFATIGSALGVTTVLLGPATWTSSVSDNLTVVDAHRPAAGPASREVATVLSGRLLRILPNTETTRIATYLTTHANGEKYLAAIPWAPQAGPFIHAGIPVLPVGGFTAQAPTITPTHLDDLVARGELRYALVDGPDAKGMVTRDYPEYALWVRRTCTPKAELTRPHYTLYDCLTTG